MRILTKAREIERAELVEALRSLAEKVDAFASDVAGDARSDFEEKSERWRDESDAGAAAGAAIDEWDDFTADDVTNVADALEALPGESES